MLDWPSGACSFEDVTLRLRGLPRPGHAPDHSVFLLEEERVGHSADLINIDQLPFGGFAGQDPLVLFKPNLEFARSLEFDWFCGGHGNIGEKSDFDFYLTYLDEVAALVDEYVPRPASVPDLSLTDYLSGLDYDGRSRLLSGLDNHFGLYLYGRKIAAGEERSRRRQPVHQRHDRRVVGGAEGQSTRRSRTSSNGCGRSTAACTTSTTPSRATSG